MQVYFNSLWYSGENKKNGGSSSGNFLPSVSGSYPQPKTLDQTTSIGRQITGRFCWNYDVVHFSFSKIRPIGNRLLPATHKWLVMLQMNYVITNSVKTVCPQLLIKWKNSIKVIQEYPHNLVEIFSRHFSNFLMLYQVKDPVFLKARSIEKMFRSYPHPWIFGPYFKCTKTVKSVT